MINGYERKLDPRLVKKESASALWCLQMSHQTKEHPMSCGRLYVTENDYTRHVLAKQLLILTDGEENMLGTVIMNNVDGDAEIDDSWLRRLRDKNMLEFSSEEGVGDSQLISIGEFTNCGAVRARWCQPWSRCGMVPLVGPDESISSGYRLVEYKNFPDFRFTRAMGGCLCRWWCAGSMPSIFVVVRHAGERADLYDVWPTYCTVLTRNATVVFRLAQ